MPNPEKHPQHPTIYKSDEKPDSKSDYFIICPLIRGCDPQCDRAKIKIVTGKKKAQRAAEHISCGGCTYPYP